MAPGPAVVVLGEGGDEEVRGSGGAGSESGLCAFTVWVPSTDPKASLNVLVPKADVARLLALALAKASDEH